MSADSAVSWPRLLVGLILVTGAAGTVGGMVDEGALRVHVATLRKALGDGRAGKRYIANGSRPGLQLRSAWAARVRATGKLPAGWSGCSQ